MFEQNGYSLRLQLHNMKLILIVHNSIVLTALYMVVITKNIIAIVLLIPTTTYMHLWLLISYFHLCNIWVIISYVGMAVTGRLITSHVAMVSG